jgi:hypothetical protein
MKLTSWVFAALLVPFTLATVPTEKTDPLQSTADPCDGQLAASHERPPPLLLPLPRFFPYRASAPAEPHSQIPYHDSKAPGSSQEFRRKSDDRSGCGTLRLVSRSPNLSLSHVVLGGAVYVIQVDLVARQDQHRPDGLPARG